MPLSSTRVAVVTGANKGIGYHIAAQLIASRLFGTVVLACRDEGRGLHAARQLGGEYLPLTLGDEASALAFATAVRERYGRCDVLVNNAGTAFKGSDPTPFAEQTRPTLNVNYRGTLQLTEALLPMLVEQPDARVVNVASMAGRLQQLSPARRQQFSSERLTIAALSGLVDEFESDVATGKHKAKGWGNSNYGLSKVRASSPRPHRLGISPLPLCLSHVCSWLSSPPPRCTLGSTRSFA